MLCALTFWLDSHLLGSMGLVIAVRTIEVVIDTIDFFLFTRTCIIPS